MKWELHARQHMKHQVWAMGLFAEGIARMGQDLELTGAVGPHGGDVCVAWGKRNVPHDCRTFIVLENGYVNGTTGTYSEQRVRFISACVNGQHGHSVMPAGCTPDRALKHSIVAEPYTNNPDGPVIFMGQVPGDYSVQHVPYHRMVKSACQRMVEAYGAARCWFKPHPLEQEAATPLQRWNYPLSTALDEAALIVTVNSTAAVEAVLRGVPCVTLDAMSVAYSVTGHDPADMGSAIEAMSGGTQWVYNLMHMQWTPDEIASGETVEWLTNAIKSGKCNAS